MECNGRTYADHVDDKLGEIRYVFCDGCRAIAVDAWDGHRKRWDWGITYLDAIVPSRVSRHTWRERVRQFLRLSPA